MCRQSWARKSNLRPCPQNNLNRLLEDLPAYLPALAAVSVAPAVFLYLSNQAMIAEALAADWDGRAAMPPWLAFGTFTSIVGTPFSFSAE